jgi:hypothetical protein
LVTLLIFCIIVNGKNLTDSNSTTGEDVDKPVPPPPPPPPPPPINYHPMSCGTCIEKGGRYCLSQDDFTKGSCCD